MNSMDVFSLKGELALITGGGSGLGFGVAKAMIAAGARVVITGRREDQLREAAEALSAQFHIHDVTDAQSTSELLQWMDAETGQPTILVNNAGNHVKKPAVDTSDDDFTSILQTHVQGAFRLTRAVLPGMIERRHGSVLFMASMASLFGIPMVSAYSAAKSAYLGLVRSLAVEVSQHGIRVNGIAPGWIESPMMLNALEGDPERKNKILSRTPLNRFGSAEDIGWAAVYLCSPAAQFVNGVILPVDGGVSIGF